MGIGCPLLDLMTEDAPRRTYPLREVFNGLRWIARAGAPRRMMAHDLPPWQVIHQQTRRWMEAKVFENLVDDEMVEVAFVDQGYTGDQAAEDAASQGIRLEVVKLPEARRGFVLLPRRWVVERSLGWMARFRRLARDYERLPETLAGLHYLAFVLVTPKRFVDVMAQS
jgi:transposase